MADGLYIRVLHRLPGRLRLRLSSAPQRPGDMERTVKLHAGVQEVTYSPHTRSLLLRFDGSEISQEELIIRAAVFVSLDNELAPVRVYSDYEATGLSNSAYLSGFLILTALASRLVPRLAPARNLLDWAGGAGTAYAVLDHAYGELKERDSFDPEVLSVIYLMTSFAQGRVLPAALFSWIATFGRHLMEYSSRNIEVRAARTDAGDGDESPYEVVVTPIKQLPVRRGILRLLPALIMHAATGDTAHIQGTLLEQVRKITQDHGDVLEGFGKLEHGMPIRFRRTAP